MSGNNFTGDANLDKSWPRPTRPLTFSDVTGPSVTNLLDSRPKQESISHPEAHSSSSKQLDLSHAASLVPKGQSKPDMQPTSEQPFLSRQKESITSKEENLSIVMPRLQSGISDAYAKPPAMPYHGQMHHPQHYSAMPMEMPFQYQPLPSALVDHHFGFAAGMSNPSINMPHYGGKSFEEEKQLSQAVKTDVYRNKEDFVMDQESGKMDVEVKDENAFEQAKAESKPDMEGIDENVNEEVYCICRTSDTDRFMM